MAQATITARVDAKDKAEFDAFCSNVGLNTSTAINMFVKAVLRENRIPFEIAQSSDSLYSKTNITQKLDVPNDTTVAAIEEGRRMMSDPDSPRYSSMDALKAALEV